MKREQWGCRALQLFDGEREKRKGSLINFKFFFYFILFFANSRPNAQLQHIFFVQNVAEKKKQNGKNVTTSKERASLFTRRREQQKILPFRCCKIFFFHFLLKDRKKPVIKCFSLYVEFVCYRRNENLFVPFEIVYV